MREWADSDEDIKNNSLITDIFQAQRERKQTLLETKET